MKVSFLFTGLVLVACSVNPGSDVNFDNPRNDWEREFLYGRVKELNQFKANLLNSEKLISEEPVREFTKKFTEFGELLYAEYFDGLGGIYQYQNYSYNSNHKKISLAIKNCSANSDFSEMKEFDHYNANGNPDSSNIVLDDSIHETIRFETGNDHYPVRQTSVQNGDTTASKYTYRFNEKKQVLFKHVWEIKRNDTFEYTIENKYDLIGNLTEAINKSKLGVSRTVYEYSSDGRRSKLTEYMDGQVIKQTLYDAYSNPRLISYFTNDSVTRELRYNYKYDSLNNWIERHAEVKDGGKNDGSYIPVFIQSRKIEYFK
jgi:hypothetical protein